MVGLVSEPGPVGLQVALVVAVQRMEHPRPGKKRWPSPGGGRGNNRMPYETPAATAAALSDRTKLAASIVHANQGFCFALTLRQ